MSCLTAVIAPACLVDYYVYIIIIAVTSRLYYTLHVYTGCHGATTDLTLSTAEYCSMSCLTAVIAPSCLVDYYIYITMIAVTSRLYYTLHVIKDVTESPSTPT